MKRHCCCQTSCTHWQKSNQSGAFDGCQVLLSALGRIICVIWTAVHDPVSSQAVTPAVATARLQTLTPLRLPSSCNQKPVRQLQQSVLSWSWFCEGSPLLLHSNSAISQSNVSAQNPQVHQITAHSSTDRDRHNLMPSSPARRVIKASASLLSLGLVSMPWMDLC